MIKNSLISLGVFLLSSSGLRQPLEMQIEYGVFEPEIEKFSLIKFLSNILFLPVILLVITIIGIIIYFSRKRK